MKYRSMQLAGAVMSAAMIFASTAGAVSTSTDQQTKLATMIAKGDQEIARRLTSLGKLTNLINSATRLTSTDKATLTSEVSSTVSGLDAIKMKLDAETTVDGAHTDVQSIFDEYRVYALVLPKVHLIKTADDLAVVQAKLSDAASKLQQRLATLKSEGKDVTGLETTLADMNAKLAAAQTVASLQATIINLQPSDYNSDHNVLSGYNAQFKAARANLVSARQDAETIVQGIRSLEGTAQK